MMESAQIKLDRRVIAREDLAEALAVSAAETAAALWLAQAPGS